MRVSREVLEVSQIKSSHSDVSQEITNNRIFLLHQSGEYHIKYTVYCQLLLRFAGICLKGSISDLL